MFSAFFIERPKFAFVISIVITIAGLVAMGALPVALYPELSPPQVQVIAVYPGADAESLILAQQLYLHKLPAVGVPIDFEHADVGISQGNDANAGKSIEHPASVVCAGKSFARHVEMTGHRQCAKLDQPIEIPGQGGAQIVPGRRVMAHRVVAHRALPFNEQLHPARSVS